MMNKYIQIQTDLGNLLPRSDFVALIVKLSFSAPMMYHTLVPLVLRGMSA